MNPLPRLTRLFGSVAIASALLIALILMFIADVVVKQNQKNRDYERKLEPSIQFVDSFLQSKHRLPRQNEFDKRPTAETDWMVDLVTEDSADDGFGSHGGRNPNDFCVRIWRGEQWTYYLSWNKKFDIVEPK